jgi:hypothetical protein
MLLTGKGLVEFTKTKLGTPYVYGMKGSILTKDKFTTLQKMYGVNYVWQSDANKIGKVCCDCSGLISWYTNKMYGSSQLYDNAIERHPISTIGDAPIGALVWKRGHVGVYIGYENGVPMYIAEDGSAYGCRKNKLSNSKFTHWLLMPYITYDASTAYSHTSIPGIHYKGHCQSVGDTKIVCDGMTCGTTGRSLRMEALTITSIDNAPGIGIVMQGHSQSIGWGKEIRADGKSYIGTKNNSLRLEAIKLRIVGENASKYKIEYRVHMQSIGWGIWVSDGQIAGTVGQSRRVEAVQIRLVLR